MRRLLLLLLLVPLMSVSGAYLENVPQTLVQPNGDTLRCFASGDEFFNWYHDADGNTIMRSPESGWLVYADKVDDRLLPTEYVAGQDRPQGKGLEPWLRISQDEYLKQRDTYESADKARGAPTIGHINNICIFIRFAGADDFSDFRVTYTSRFDETNPDSSSMHNFYDEASYGQLSITTDCCPTCEFWERASVQSDYYRSRWQPYDSVTNRNGYVDSTKDAIEEELLAWALNEVMDEIDTTLDYDGNNDGLVDNVCFIIEGEVDGWNYILWPHMATLNLEEVYIGDLRVWAYNLNVESNASVGTLCHEMGHSLGAPDFYRYDEDYDHVSPVAWWDLMVSDLDPPQHQSAFTKYKYYDRIASIPLAPYGGTHTLNPLIEDDDNCLRLVDSDRPGEYWVVEYRRRTGRCESSLPASGLLVYRINDTVNGNSGGPPDEVYIYRPGGTNDVNGTTVQAAYSANAGRTSISRYSSPSCFLSDDTDGGLFIADIGYVGETMSFYATTEYFDTGGTLSDGNGGPIAPPSPVYQYVTVLSSDVTVRSGQTLTFENGARVYSLDDLSWVANGEISVEGGSDWTELFQTSGYRRGIRSRGEIRVHNGGEIRFR